MPYQSTDVDEWPAEPLVALETPFVDGRGRIQPLVDRMMRSAVLIESKKGALRANHYHKTGWHYCYVISGCVEYYHRPHGSEGEAEFLLVKAGQMVFTPPMVEHAMKFLEDTVFVTLDSNSRDQESYERDLVRIELIKAQK
jgi:quercetin dioxygenase-like cupin family protein